MSELVTLLRRYQGTMDLEEKLNTAEDLIRCIGPKLLVFVAASCPPAMVDDVVQETFIAIAKGLEGLRGQSERELEGWCYTIARRRLADKLRKQKAEPLDRLSPEVLWELVESTAADKPLPLGARGDLEYALGLLKAAKQPCYVYLLSHFIFDMDFTEMAKAYESTYNAMRVKTNRCLKLAQALNAKHP